MVAVADFDRARRCRLIGGRKWFGGSTVYLHSLLIFSSRQSSERSSYGATAFGNVACLLLRCDDLHVDFLAYIPSRVLPGGLSVGAESLRSNPRHGADNLTCGVLVHFHPPVHAIVTDGIFTPGGTLICGRRPLPQWPKFVVDSYC